MIINHSQLWPWLVITGYFHGITIYFYGVTRPHESMSSPKTLQGGPQMIYVENHRKTMGKWGFHLIYSWFMIAKLVNITWITVVYDTYNYSSHGVYQPTCNRGSPHCSGFTKQQCSHSKKCHVESHCGDVIKEYGYRLLFKRNNIWIGLTIDLSSYFWIYIYIFKYEYIYIYMY